MFVELREQRSSGAIRRLARKSGNIFDPHKHEEEAKRFFEEN